MDEFWGMSGTTWTAIYTLVTFGLLVVAVVAALYAKKQLESGRALAEDARRANLEAHRPYVLVTLEPSGASEQLFDLGVANIGQRPAFDVAITLDPPPVRADETPGHEISKVKMLNEPVAMIAPGQKLRTFYDSHIDRSPRTDLPTVHRTALIYRDSSGREYTEASVLDIEAMKGAMFTSVKTVHDIGKTLEKMQKTLNSASLLQRNGRLQIDASVESRNEKLDRETREHAEQAAARAELLSHFQSNNQRQPIDTETEK